MDLFSVVSKGTQGELEQSHCQSALGKACKGTPWVLAAKFRQDEGGEEALSGYCMSWIMDIHIHHDGELIHAALAGWGSVKYLMSPSIPLSADSYTLNITVDAKTVQTCGGNIFIFFNKKEV